MGQVSPLFLVISLFVSCRSTLHNARCIDWPLLAVAEVLHRRNNNSCKPKGGVFSGADVGGQCVIRDCSVV